MSRPRTLPVDEFTGVDDAASRRRRARSEEEAGEGAAIRLDRVAAFGVGFLVPTALALQQGGYDIVARQQVWLVIWWGLALAYAFGVLPAASPPRSLRAPLLGLVALVAWTAVSLIWSSSLERTFAEVARVVGLTGVLALTWAVVTRDSWRSAAAGLTTAALSVALLSVIARLAPAALPGVDFISVDARLTYPFGYWNAVGAWGAMAIALGLSFSCGSARPGGRALALGLVPVAALAVHLSYSRGAVVGAIVAVGAVIVLSRDRWTPTVHALAALAGTGIVIFVVRTQTEIADGTGGSGGFLVALALVAAGLLCAWVALRTRRGHAAEARRPPRPLLVVVAGLAATTIVAVAFGPRPVSPPPADPSQQTYPAAGEDPASRLVNAEGVRPAIWSEALDAFAERPLSGIGAGTFEFRWASQRSDPPLRDAHSLYLETAAELGIPGLLALLVFILGLLVAAIKSLSRLRRASSVGMAAGLVATLLVFCVQAGIDWLWEIPAISSLAFTSAAVAVGASSEGRRRRRRLTAGGAVAALGAVAAGALMIPGIASTEFVRSSGSLTLRGATGRALDYADSAVTAQPWSASAYAQRSIVERVRGELEAATDDAERAIELEPQNWYHRYLLATVQHAAGSDEAALANLKQAARLQAVDPAKVTDLSVLDEGKAP